MKNRDRFAKRLVSLIIAALLVCTAGPVFAEGEEAASPFIDSAPSAAAVTGGQVRFIENEPKNEVKNIGFNSRLAFSHHRQETNRRLYRDSSSGLRTGIR